MYGTWICPLGSRGLLSGLAVWIVVFSMRAELGEAQHNDVLVQQRDGSLVTGGANFETGRFEVGAGQRVFGGQVLTLEGGRLVASDPGFVAVNAPAGEPPAFALPASKPVSFNVLPMSIGGEMASLFYWTGSEGSDLEDVSFRPVPSDLELVIRSGFRRTTVTASSGRVTGHVLDNTSATGTLHTHPNFEFSRANEVPVDALYLISLEVAMSDLAPSAPIYLILGRENPHPFAVPPSPFFDFADFWDPREEAATAWVTQTLLNPVVSLCGDLDTDRDVDSADLLALIENWTGSSDPGTGTSTFQQGDCDRDGDVDSADLLGFISAWTGANNDRSVGVPEPAWGAGLLLGLLIAVRTRRV